MNWFRRKVSIKENTVETFLIAGLGNPGHEYADTRHNAGFMVVDRFAKSKGIRMSRVQFNAILGSEKFNGSKVIVAKPQTYMNLSGQAVGSLMKFYKIPMKNLLVVFDDLDLSLGVLRIRPTGGAGGHKGLRSIIQRLGTQDFARVRFGIGRPPGRMDSAAYVLQPFFKDDHELVEMILQKGAEAVSSFIEVGLENTMNRYNGSI